MKSFLIFLSVVALLFCFGAMPCVAQVPAAGVASTAEVEASPGVKVKIQVPAGWEKTGVPSTVRLMSPGKEVVVLLSVLPDDKGAFTTQEKVNAVAQTANERNVDGSVEKKVTLVQVVSKSGIGAYAIFTDEKLAGVATVPPGSYRCVAQGLYAMKGVGVSFTVLGNDTKSAEFQQALKIISDGIGM